MQSLIFVHIGRASMKHLLSHDFEHRKGDVIEDKSALFLSCAKPHCVALTLLVMQHLDLTWHCLRTAAMQPLTGPAVVGSVS